MGDVCGEKTIHVTEGSNLSSFLEPNGFGKEEFKTIKVVSEEVVEVSTIENFLTTQVPDFDKRRILLKMDTQGYDLNVSMCSRVRSRCWEASFAPCRSFL